MAAPRVSLSRAETHGNTGVWEKNQLTDLLLYLADHEIKVTMKINTINWVITVVTSKKKKNNIFVTITKNKVFHFLTKNIALFARYTNYRTLCDIKSFMSSYM